MTTDHSPIPANTVQDMVALACYSFGYRPSDCLVLVGIGNQSVTVLARVDLAQPGGIGPALAQVRGSGADAVIVLVFSDAEPFPDDVTPAVAAAARAHALQPLDVIWVGPTRYASLWLTDPDQPPRGQQVADALTDSVVAAQAVIEGRTSQPRREDLIADTQPCDVLPASTVEAAEPEDAYAWIAAWTTWLNNLQHPDNVNPDNLKPGGPQDREKVQDPEKIDWVRAVAGINQWQLRDVVVIAALAPELEPAAVLGSEDAMLAEVITRRPDRDHLSVTTRMLAAVAARAPAGWRADPLAAYALLAWQAGDAVRARLLAQAAQQDRPQHALAGLVERLLHTGAPPPWLKHV